MEQKRDHLSSRETNRGLRWVYGFTFIVMAFTGMGQMPIFKRYYISDIPGMGWSADFFLTHYIHYLGAIFLGGLIAYILADFLFAGRRVLRLTPRAYVQGLFLAGIVVTGAFRVLKNLPDIVFSPGVTMMIDISHLVFMLLYVTTALIFAFGKIGWVKTKTPWQ
jgi:hypothetical protein